jgi:hypothetical protein
MATKIENGQSTAIIGKYKSRVYLVEMTLRASCPHLKELVVTETLGAQSTRLAQVREMEIVNRESALSLANATFIGTNKND